MLKLIRLLLGQTASRGRAAPETLVSPYLFASRPADQDIVREEYYTRRLPASQSGSVLAKAVTSDQIDDVSHSKKLVMTFLKRRRARRPAVATCHWRRVVISAGDAHCAWLRCTS